MLNHPEIQKIGRVADLLASRGWGEANAGNMSVWFRREEVPVLTHGAETISMKHRFPSLDGEFFLMTATGSRSRDISRIPESTIGLLKITGNGTALECHWGASPPTSEYPAHLSVYAMCGENRRDMRAILHTHPPYLIAMTHLSEFQKPESLNVALRKMHPEVGILVPSGIMGMDYKIPGSMELGEATRDAVLGCNVAIWPKHGVVSIAPDLDKALDQVEILEKAARIYMLVRATGQDPVGLTDEQVRESREYWGIRGDAD